MLQQTIIRSTIFFYISIAVVALVSVVAQAGDDRMDEQDGKYLQILTKISAEVAKENSRSLRVKNLSEKIAILDNSRAQMHGLLTEGASVGWTMAIVHSKTILSKAVAKNCERDSMLNQFVMWEGNGPELENKSAREIEASSPRISAAMRLFDLVCDARLKE